MRALILWLCLSVAALADHVKIIGPNEVARGALCILRIDGLEKPAEAVFAWTVAPADLVIADLMDRQGNPVLLVPTDRDGTWHLVLAHLHGSKINQVVHTVKVGAGPQPVPPGPNPPGPTPVPPGPTPMPGVGFRVFILEETAERDRATALVLNSTRVREYLNAKCAKGPDGKTPEFRIWDDDITPGELSHAPENWRKAFERAKADSKGSVPWLIVSDSVRGESRPLPKTEDELLAVLRAYGGN